MLYALLILVLYSIFKSNLNREKIMAQIDDLNVLIDAVAADVVAVGADVTEVLQLLTNAQGTSQDLTPAIAKLTAVKTALDNVDASLKAVEPAVVPELPTSEPAPSA